MKIVKILGILDILAALFFWLFAFFKIIPDNWILIIAFYLLVKGTVFLLSKDFASMLDIACSILIFVSLSFSMPEVISALVTLYLIQKGIFSLLS
jgi:hypothetical protein